MGKLTRSGFLVVGVAALASVANLLVGCGAGTEKNTPYFGTYGGDWLIQSRVNDVPPTYDPQLSGPFNVSIDEKGHMLGFIKGVSRTTYALDGNVNENGGFDGVMRLDSVAYHFTGKMSEQLVTLMTTENYKDIFGVNIITVGDTGTAKAGVAGNFKITIDGVEYRGVFNATGGQTTTGG